MAMNFYEKVTTLGEMLDKLANGECNNFTKIYEIYFTTREEDINKLDFPFVRIGQTWDYLIDIYYRDCYLSDILEMIDDIITNVSLYIGKENLTNDEKWIIEQIVEF